LSWQDYLIHTVTIEKNEIIFMPKKVRIPTPLRKLTNNEELVEVNAATIGEAIYHLTVSSL